MVCRVEVVAGVADWLAELRKTDPLAARLVDDAVSALATQGAGLGWPLAAPLESVWNLPEALDEWYQGKLDRLRRVRRSMADAEHSGVTQEAHELRARHDRMQTNTDVFRARKERLKAGYLAAQAIAEVADLLGEPISGDDRRPSEGLTFKVLRPAGIADREVRILFVIEPGNTAVLLYGAASEQDAQSWYTEVIPEALRRYKRHTDEGMERA